MAGAAAKIGDAAGPATEVDMTNKVCIVTGSNTGIGLVTAAELAKRGAAVVLACRSQEKCKVAQEAVAEAVRTAGRPGTAGTAECMSLDLSSFASVRSFVDAFAASHDRLDVLVNNAGIMIPPYTLTADGFESQFQVNHLSHYLLTRLLAPLLDKSPSPTVVNVSSLAGERASLKPGEFEKVARCTKNDYNAIRAYSQSKLAQVLFTVEMNRRMGDKIAVNALHPGVINTEIATRGQLPAFLRPLYGIVSWFLKSPEEGAKTTVYLATTPREITGSGGYFANSRPKKANSLAMDAELCREWWDESARAVGVEP